jgi:alkylhydroperoxidase/carboxymuconolactone decarboxylase family protein YurZ
MRALHPATTARASCGSGESSSGSDDGGSPARPYGRLDVDRIERLLCRLTLHDERSVRAALADPGLSGLDPKVQALVGLGALLSVDAATVSVRLLVDEAYRAGATEDEIVGVLLAVAPAIGHARTVAVAPRLALALGYDVDDDSEP